MLFDDDSDPKTKKRKPRVLTDFSVPELKEYIQDLKAEIARAEEDMAKKEKSKAAAAALFRK